MWLAHLHTAFLPLTSSMGVDDAPLERAQLAANNDHEWKRWRLSSAFCSSYQDAALRDRRHAPLPETAPLWRLTGGELDAFLCAAAAAAGGLLRRDEAAATALADAVNHRALVEQHETTTAGSTRTRSGTRGHHYEHARLTGKDMEYFARFRAAHPSAGARLLAPSQVSSAHPQLRVVACSRGSPAGSLLRWQAMRMKMIRLRREGGEAALLAAAAAARQRPGALPERCARCTQHNGSEALVALASQPVVTHVRVVRALRC